MGISSLLATVGTWRAVAGSVDPLGPRPAAGSTRAPGGGSVGVLGLAGPTRARAGAQVHPRCACAGGPDGESGAGPGHSG